MKIGNLLKKVNLSDVRRNAIKLMNLGVKYQNLSGDEIFNLFKRSYAGVDKNSLRNELVWWYSNAVEVIYKSCKDCSKEQLQKLYDEFNKNYLQAVCKYMWTYLANYDWKTEFNNLIMNIFELELVFGGEKYIRPNALKIKCLEGICANIQYGKIICTDILELYMNDFVTLSDSEDDYLVLKSIDLYDSRVSYILGQSLSMLEGYNRQQHEDVGDDDEIVEYAHVEFDVLLKYIPKYFPEHIAQAMRLALINAVVFGCANTERVYSNHYSTKAIVRIVEDMAYYKNYEGIYFEFEDLWDVIITLLTLVYHDGVALTRVKELFVNWLDISEDEINSELKTTLNVFMKEYLKNEKRDNTQISSLMAEPFLFKVISEEYPFVYDYLTHV